MIFTSQNNRAFIDSGLSGIVLEDSVQPHITKFNIPLLNAIEADSTIAPKAIIKIKDDSDREAAKRLGARLVCIKLEDILNLKLISKDIIVRLESATPHIAYIIASFCFGGILVDKLELNGKLIYKLKEAMAKKSRFYYHAIRGGVRGVEIKGIDDVFALDSNRHSIEHSSLGNHFIDLLDFRELTDSSLVNPLKSSKNSKSHTANIRMLGDSNAMEFLDSNLDSSVESSVDSTLDSKRSLESSNNNPHEVRTLKACSGDKGVVKGGEGATLRLSRTPFSPFEDERIESDKLIGDSKGLKDSGVESALDSMVSKDSTLCVESNKINSVCGMHHKEVSSGERESVREGEGSELASSACSCKVKHSKIQAPSPSLENGSLENGSLVEDSKELEDSTNLNFKDSNVDSSPDSNNLKDSSNLVESTLESLDSTNFADSTNTQKYNAITLHIDFHSKQILQLLKAKNLLKIGIVDNKASYNLALNLLQEDLLDSIYLKTPLDLPKAYQNKTLAFFSDSFSTLGGVYEIIYQNFKSI